jgi:hypothetical protein
MFTPSMISLPGEFAYHLGRDSIPGVVWGQGMSFADFMAFWTYAIVAFALIWFAPNTAQIFGLDERGVGEPSRIRIGPRFRLVATTALLWVSCFGIFSAVPSEFLYFQF